MVLDLSRLPADALEWASYHGEGDGGRLRFACGCKKLRAGECSVYEERPQVCRDFAIGSLGCLEAIKHHVPHKAETLVAMMHRDGVFNGDTV